VRRVAGWSGSDLRLSEAKSSRKVRAVSGPLGLVVTGKPLKVFVTRAKVRAFGLQVRLMIEDGEGITVVEALVSRDSVEDPRALLDWLRAPELPPHEPDETEPLF